MTDLQYRAILIDPETQIVDVVMTDASLAELHALTDAATLDTFRIADHEDSWDYGWVSDTGLSDGKPVHAFLLGRRDPIAGRCLLVGVDKETRDSTDAKFPLDILRDSITWLGLIKPEVVWDTNGRVERAIVTYEKVKL